MRILPSAHKHGIRDQDIHHALNHHLVTLDLDDRRRQYLGPDRTVNFLEVVVARNDGEEVVIHADRMKKKWERFLP